MVYLLPIWFAEHPSHVTGASGKFTTTRYIYGCPCCGKRFTTKFNMERHQKKCGSLVSQSCQLCGKTFMTHDSLKQHMSIVHYKYN